MQEFFFCTPFKPPLTCPLLFSEEEWDLQPTTRLFEDWALLNECAYQIREAQKRRAICVSLGFGLDVILHAATKRGFEIDDPDVAEVIKVHGDLVQMRLYQQHLRPPFYFVTESTPEAISDRMIQFAPQLTGISPSVRRRFAKYEMSLADRYEAEVPHQTGFHHVEASHRAEVMLENILPIAVARIRAWQEAT